MENNEILRHNGLILIVHLHLYPVPFEMIQDILHLLLLGVPHTALNDCITPLHEVL